MPTKQRDILEKSQSKRGQKGIKKQAEIDRSRVQTKAPEQKQKRNGENANKENSKEVSVYNRLHLPLANQKMKKNSTKERPKNKIPSQSHDGLLPARNGDRTHRKHFQKSNKDSVDFPRNTRGIEGLIETSQHSDSPSYKASAVKKKEKVHFDRHTYKTRSDRKWDSMIERSIVCSGNKVSEYRDTNKIAKSLSQLGMVDESRLFAKLVTDRYKLEEDFIKINKKDGIRTIEGDFDSHASNKHTSIGGLKVEGVPKGFIMVDEYDPRILKKNSDALREYEYKATLIHKNAMQELFFDRAVKR